MVKKRFEWVDHPSDTGFRAYGESLEEAYENAAFALTNIMSDTEKIKPKGEISIDLRAEDLKALLYDWLEFFLYLHDAEDMIASEFDVRKISEEDGGYKLEAVVRGEKYDSEHHVTGTEVKAMTYHMMEIDCGPDRCSVQAIVDI